MWANNETDGDLLGFEIHANLVRFGVNNPAILHVTVAPLGDSGRGKSSILKLLKRDLASPDTGDQETLVI